MKGIKGYQRPNRPAQVTAFLENLEPKFRDKLVLQLYRLSQTPRAELREPHYKHFSIERYQPLYEIRERGRVVVRIVFAYLPSGEVLLLTAFIKRKNRDTMQALEQSLRILAEVQDCPDYAVEFRVKEECT